MRRARVTKLNSIVLAFLMVFGVAAVASAQEPAPKPEPVPARLVPLEVEVVITRYDGTKKISSLPYVLAVNGNGPVVQLNMGTQIAVPTSAFTPKADDKVQPLMSYSYRDVGTKISARAYAQTDGGFDLELNIDDSSVFTSSVSGAPMPAFRNFSTRNRILLRDGQIREYTAATDRVSGEVVKGRV